MSAPVSLTFFSVLSETLFAYILPVSNEKRKWRILQYRLCHDHRTSIIDSQHWKINFFDDRWNENVIITISFRDLPCRLSFWVLFSLFRGFQFVLSAFSQAFWLLWFPFCLPFPSSLPFEQINNPPLSLWRCIFLFLHTFTFNYSGIILYLSRYSYLDYVYFV